MDLIYSEMMQRNVDWLRCNAAVVDPMLITPEQDDRRCIALIARDEISIQQDFTHMQQYGMRPKLHHTVLVLSGWTTKDKLVIPDLTELQQIIKEIPSYTVVFDRLIPVKTGLVMCGTASIDVNAIRDKLRAVGYEKGALYKNDIIHSTLLRWTTQLTEKEQSDWLSTVLSHSNSVYAELRVTRLDVVCASWTMQEGTYEVIRSFIL
jgi:hypothetical protein